MFFKNKIVVYLITRYLTYGLQFFISMVVAVRLGPYYLGLYGIIQLILNYASQFNWGIPHSLNVLLVHNKNDEKKQNSLIFNSLVLFSFLNILLVFLLLFAKFMGKAMVGDLDLNRYLIILVLIAGITYYNSIFSTVIRFRNKVNQLSIVGSIPVLIDLIIIWFFEKEGLVYALTISNLVSCVISTAYFRFIGAFPKIRLCLFSKKQQIEIFKKGLYLFMYNSCLYFMLLGVRTIVSSNYPLQEFGYFTFSFTIVNAVMLLLNSLDIIIFPKVIDRLSNVKKDVCYNTLKTLRVCYISTSHLLIYIALAVFPLFLKFFPQYENAISTMNMIALAVLMRSNSYGYNSLLIARNYEKIASHISMISLIISLLLGFFMAIVLHVPSSNIVISVLLAYLFCSYLMTYYGEKVLSNRLTYRSVFKRCFPLIIFLPYILALLISIMEKENLIILPLIVYLILNKNDVINIKDYVLKMIKSPNVIDL